MHTEPAVGRELLILALRRQAHIVQTELEGWPTASPKDFTLDLRGLPSYTLAKLTGARRHDGTIRVHVHALNGVEVAPVDEPLLIDLAPTPDPLQVEDDSIEGKNGSRWYPAPGGMQREVVDVDDAEEPVYRNVNTDRYNYQLTCSCGNVRYAMKNSLHQVDRCRPCAKRRRHAYQVAWQRERRRK